MPAHQHICFQQHNPFNVKNHKTTHIKTQAKYQPKGLCKFGDHCLGTICPRDLLLAKPAQVFLSMPTWKHGHAQKRPTPLLTLGVGVHPQAKKSDDFLQYALGGCQFTEIWSHLWHKMWKFTTYKSVTNDPPIFEPICG